MSEVEDTKFSVIRDVGNICEAIRYETKKEDASKRFLNMIPADDCDMDLGAEEISDSKYKQSSSRQGKEIEFNTAKESFIDYLDIVHKRLESYIRNSFQDNYDKSILRRTRRVFSCASFGSGSETQQCNMRNIESSCKEDRVETEEITRKCKRGTKSFLQPIRTSERETKISDSYIGISLGSLANAIKRKQMESKERFDKNKGKMHDENTGPSVDSSNMRRKTDFNTFSSLNPALPSKKNSHKSITNTSENEQANHPEKPHLLSESFQPSTILIAIPTSNNSSHSTIPNSSASSQEPSKIFPSVASPILESNLPEYSDTDIEPSNHIESDSIITFDYPIPNIIIQTTSTDSLPQKVPNRKFSINLKTRIHHLAPCTKNPLSDICSADKIYDRHELVNKTDSETEHHYTSHLNWWDNVRTRLIHKYGIDRDRSISEKYARDLRGMRYILKNPFDKTHNQPEERTSVIELISKKIIQTSSTSEVDISQGSNITETNGVAGNNQSKEIKMNQTSLKPDRYNAKQEKSKDTKQMESLGSISEKKPRRIAKSCSKSMLEDKNAAKKKADHAKDQNIKKHDRSSSNSLKTEKSSSQKSNIKHIPMTQSTKMNLNSRNVSHNRLPSISSKDSNSLTIPSRSNPNISSITRTTEGSFEKKTSHQKLKWANRTETTNRVSSVNHTISNEGPCKKTLSKHDSVILKSPSSYSSSEVLINSMVSKMTDSKYIPSRDDSFSFPKHSKTNQSLPKASSPLGPRKSIKPLEFYKVSCNKNNLSKKTLSDYKYLAYLDTDFNSSSSQLVLLYPDIKVTTAKDLTKAYGVTMETIKNKVMPISASINI